MQRTLRSALVSTKWLQEVVTSKPPNHRILDAAYHLPNTGRNAAHEFTVKHIPGALYFDVDACADVSVNIPHMLPSPEMFENYVGDLGINNDTHVIVYDNNPQFPLFSAERLWWTFRIFGHDKVSVVEGGLQKWEAEGGEVTAKVEDVPKEKFSAKFHSHLVKSYADIEANVKTPAFQLMDARPEGRFKGTAPEPRDDTKPGCIPESSSIPFMSMLDVENKCLKKPGELRRIFTEKGISLDKPLVATCGSGMTACMLALAAYECGNDNVAVYDGSWTEWYKLAPAELKKNVPSD